MNFSTVRVDFQYGDLVAWLELLRQLPPDRRAVVHKPPTERYGIAYQKLHYVVRNALFLGTQPDAERPGSFLLAVWASPSDGRGFGYYCCFRLYFEEGDITFAAMYCFYDGTRKSPGFKTFDAALSYAQSNGFRGSP